MNPQKSLFLLVLIFLLCSPKFALSIPAFPGAEGYGANSIGGRGGQVIKVTNLNDSGPGSFRAAVQASGHRIVVFEASGIINLKSTLSIRYPYITIAGQTSPGGILVTGRPTIINTHDVIMQHMRFRVGSHNVADAESHDTINIWGDGGPDTNPGYNVIIDHCSFSWGIDENFSISYAAKDITLQWNIVSEGLSNAGHPKGEHSKGILISGKYGGSKNISLHHNYIAHNTDRNPLIGAGTDYAEADVVNNVVYNFKGSLSMNTQNKAKVNYIHNYVKRGPNSNDHAFEAVHFPDGNPAEPIIYVEGNFGIRRLDQTADEWCVGYLWEDQVLNEAYRKATKWPAPPIRFSIMSSEIAECILSAVGATAPIRDTVDSRVVADFFARTGAIIDNVKYPDDFPSFESIEAPADNDNDGMADSWELSKGLDTTADDSALDKDNDGYTNIEEYLYHLSISSFSENSNCMQAIFSPLAPNNLRVTFP